MQSSPYYLSQAQPAPPGPPNSSPGKSLSGMHTPPPSSGYARNASPNTSPNAIFPLHGGAGGGGGGGGGYTPWNMGGSPLAGPSRWGASDAAGGGSGMNIKRRDNTQVPAVPPSSPTDSNMYYQNNYGAFGFNAQGLGSSSNGSSHLGMSISPPNWNNMNWGSYGAGGGGGSYVGSLGALGTSFGRERDRELEAKYVRDFFCCGKQLNGMHELLEHYEEEHANLAPDIRAAALNAHQSAPPGGAQFPPLAQGQGQLSHHRTSSGANGITGAWGQTQGDAPIPPGMMDIEMDDSSMTSAGLPSTLNTANMTGALPGTMPSMGTIPNMGFAALTNTSSPNPPISQNAAPLLMQQSTLRNPAVTSLGGAAVGHTSLPPTPTTSHLWTTAFRQPTFPQTGNQGVPPSLLTFNPGVHATQSAPTTPRQPTHEELEAKALRKAQRKAERIAAREEASASDAEHEKRFPCPIEGCGKVYKQANGLKYHLTRSINSGHGNVAALGGIMHLLGDKGGD